MDFDTVRASTWTPLAQNLAQRAVLMWLAIRAGDDNMVHRVKHADIGRDVYLEPRQVRRIVTALIRAGALIAERQHDEFGHRAANLYRITLTGQSQGVTRDPLDSAAKGSPMTIPRGHGRPNKIVPTDVPKKESAPPGERFLSSLPLPLSAPASDADPSLDAAGSAPTRRKLSPEALAKLDAALAHLSEVNERDGTLRASTNDPPKRAGEDE